MKNQLTSSSTKISRKFDQQLYAILAGELKTIKIAKNHLVMNFNLPNNGLMVA